MIEIKDIHGALRYATEINEGSKRMCKLNLEADSVTLEIDCVEPIDFDLGDYCDIDGEGRFELAELPTPEINVESGVCHYSLQMDAPYMKWRNKLLKYAPNVGGYEAEWNLTATLAVHANIVIECLKFHDFAKHHNGEAYVVEIDGSIATTAKLITYSNVDIISALKLMAETWECDVWITGNIIHFGRCEASGTPTLFTEDVNMANISASKSQGTYATRLYAFGSTRNLPPNYRQSEGVVVNGVVQKRLMLPEDTPYIDAYDGMASERVIEEVVTIDEVYPRTDGTVDEVTTYSDTTQDAQGNEVTEMFYRFTEANKGFKFSADYILSGETLGVTFQSGRLNGMTFDVAFNPKGAPEKKEDAWNLDAQLFEIIANENYGRKLPDATLYPESGDKYVLFGWDSTKIAELGLVAKAEQELLAKAQIIAEKYKADANTYECTLFSDYAYGMDANGKLDSTQAKRFTLGDAVAIRCDAYFGGDTYTSRVIGYEYTLDKPFDSPKYTIGESAAYSRRSEMQRQIDDALPSIEQLIRAINDRLYLRKDGVDDNSYSPTRFFSRIMSGEFRNGIIGGAGWGFYKDANGQWVLETDRLNVRKDMNVVTLVINQAEGRSGMEVDTAAYIEVSEVEETDNGYICRFDTKSGTVANMFRVDDVAYSQRWTAEYANQKYYKRRVTAVAQDSITLSKSEANGSGIPEKGDNIIHFGNYTDTERQYIKVRDVVGGGYERYIEGLNSVDANGVEYYFVGRDASVGDGTPRWFVGNRDAIAGSGKGDGSFIEFKNGKLMLNDVALSISTTVGGKNFDEYIKEVVPPVSQEDIEGYVEAITNPKFENLQNQIDGAIDTWFGNGEPTLTNAPANDWTTAVLKNQHLGDLYYDNTTGTAYRFTKNDAGAYVWTVITDDAITKALEAAKNAQDTADGKRRVFCVEPAPPYDAGDLWVNATYGAQYKNDILRCVKAKTTGKFAISDWTLASKYTDDSKLNDFIAEYQDTIADIEKQIDGKAETWYQAADPSADWKTSEDKANHKGDLWYNTADNTTWYWTGAEWRQQDIPQSVFDTIDGKNSIYVSKPTAYKRNDLWFLEADYTLSGVAYKTGTLVVAIQDSDTFDAKHWAKKDRYTDDTEAIKALTRLSKWAADGSFSPSERTELVAEKKRIDSDKAQFVAQLGDYTGMVAKIDGLQAAYDTYISAHTAYVTLITNVVNATPDADNCVAVPKDFEASAQAYYNAKSVLASKFVSASKYYTLTQVADYEYLKKALAQDTNVSGGLIMSTLISLGTTADDGTRTTWGGMNGAYESGRTIASWWGGGMVDHEATPDAANYAQSLIRMDGSGYLAGGLLAWDNRGNVTIGAGIEIAGGTGGSHTLAQILNTLNGLNQMFVPVDKDGKELPLSQIGSAFALKAKLGLYSDSFISARGLNADGGSSGGGSSFGLMRTWPSSAPSASTSDALGANLGWDLRTRITALEGKNYLNDFNLVLSGDGNAVTTATLSANKKTLTMHKGATFLTPTDTNIKDGVITIDGVSITPLTAHQSLAAYLKIDGSNATSAGLSAMINKLTTSDTAPTDADFYVAQYAGGGTTTTTYHRRPHSALWNYIRGKADARYLQSHQAIYALTVQKNGATVGTFNPKSAAATINLTDVASAATLSSHTANTTVHITSAERTKWNKVAVTAGAKNIPIWLNGGTPTAVTDVSEHLISYADTGRAGVSYIDSVNPRLGSQNVLADIIPEALTIEYSRDAGATWADYEYADKYKRAFCTTVAKVAVGRRNNGDATVDDRTRVTIDFGAAGLYFYCGKLFANITTNYALNCKATIERYGSDGKWYTMVDTWDLSGWPNWCGISLPWVFGDNRDVSKLRITFRQEGFEGTRYNPLLINGICLTGGNKYNMPNCLAQYGTPYEMRILDDNYLFADFDYRVRSSQFISTTAYAAPLRVSSTVKVDNLNVDMLSGRYYSDFCYTELDQTTNITTTYSMGRTYVKRLDLQAGQPSGNYGNLLHVSGKYSDTAFELYSSYDFDRLHFRRGNTATLATNAWKEIAFIDSNVASATKLQTARTLWGQSFNGTGNVSGNMTGVGSIAASSTIASSYGFKRTTYGGTSWNNGYGAYNVEIVDSTTQTPLLLAYRSGSNEAATGANRLLSMELENPGTQLRFCFGGSGKFYMNSNGEFVATSLVATGAVQGATVTSSGTINGKNIELTAPTPFIDFHFGSSTADYTTRLIEDVSGRLKIEGKLAVTSTIYAATGIWSDGYVSAKGQNTSSDARLKSICGDIRLSLDAIANAPAVRFKWKDSGKAAVGTIAQYFDKILPEVVSRRDDGMLTMDYGVSALVSAIVIARKVRNHEERIQHLEAENRRLRKELEKQKSV